MNRYFSRFIFLTLIGFVFAVQINAQLCGKYTTTLQIKTADEKPVENAVIQLLPVEKDETRGKSFVRDEKDFSKFSITFFEGHQLSANYKLLISADGFENLEKEIKFPHCKNQDFDIQLLSKKSIYSSLEGIVADTNGGVIPNIQVTVADKEKIFRTYTNEYGRYFLDVPIGKYTVEFSSKSGFLTTVVKDFYAESDERYEFDVTLDVDIECPNCMFSEFVCKPKENDSEEFDCVYVSRKGKGGSKPKILKFSENKNN